MHQCVMCDGDLIVLGQLGSMTWFRCQHCGWEQSEPAVMPLAEFQSRWLDSIPNDDNESEVIS